MMFCTTVVTLEYETLEEGSVKGIMYIYVNSENLPDCLYRAIDLNMYP